MHQRQSIEDIRKRISISAFKLGIRQRENIEDCVSEITTRILEGRHQHSTIDQAVIDYLRKQYGSKRTLGSNPRKVLRPEDTKELHDNIGSDRGLFDSSKYGTLEHGIDPWELHRLVVGERNKIIFGLIHIWGLNETEIANLFGISSSRICQRIKGIQESLRQRVDKKKSRQEKTSLEKILLQENDSHAWRVESFEDKKLEAFKSW